MTDEKMLELAERSGCGWIKTGTEPALFGEAQLRKFAALVRREALEEAEQECEAAADVYMAQESRKFASMRTDAETGCRISAGRIRALAAQEGDK